MVRDVKGRIRELKQIHPGIIVAVRVELTADGMERAVELADGDVEVIHIVADMNGRQIGVGKPPVHQGHDPQDPYGPDRKR